MMKIALGMQLQEGAFGGGNQFGHALVKFLTLKNIKVAFDLKGDDIDIILLTETRKWPKSCSFDLIDVANYLMKKPDTLVVFRVNECDERKGYRLKLLDNLIIQGTRIADHVIFISSWLEKLFLSKNRHFEKKSSVIRNGGDAHTFNSEGYKRWNHKEPLGIITHHWGANWFKGFDVYLKLDELIEKKYKGKIKFTFIGNIPENIKFKNTEIISPKSGRDLAQEIKKHHVYLTGSINEPAGMHHIEGALCGLPLLYRNSGALPEYCEKYGISFEGLEDFEHTLLKMFQEYDHWANQMHTYKNSTEAMCNQYYRLFINLIRNKKHIINTRTLNVVKLHRYITFIKILAEMEKTREKFHSLLRLL